MIQPGPVFLPKGFKFAAVKAGIKASGNPDLALIIAEPKTSAAALFTRNLVTAAPVEVGRSALTKTKGRIQAVVVNSGNANCATGQPGIRDCKKVCAETARLLSMRAAEVFPSSTGIIGVQLPVDKMVSHLKALISNAGSSLEHLYKFSEAILTTDSKPKLASVPLRSGSLRLWVTLHFGGRQNAGMPRSYPPPHLGCPSPNDCRLRASIPRPD